MPYYRRRYARRYGAFRGRYRARRRYGGGGYRRRGVSSYGVKKLITRALRRKTYREEFKLTHSKLFNSATGTMRWFSNNRAAELATQPDTPWSYVYETGDGPPEGPEYSEPGRKRARFSGAMEVD